MTQVGVAVRELAIVVIDTLLYVAIFAVTAVSLFGAISPWLMLPVLVWILAYAGLTAYFVPRARARSLKVADTRSALVGRIVDSYTNILTVKLFARDREERSAVQAATTEHTDAYLHSFRLITAVTATLSLLNSTLIVVTAGVVLALWSRGQMTTGEGAAGPRPGAAADRDVGLGVMQTVRGLFENIGVVQERCRPSPCRTPSPTRRVPATSRWRAARCGSRASASITAGKRPGSSRT